MKKIWDTQSNQPLYAIDKDTLYRQIKRKISGTHRSVNYMEIGLIIVNSIVIITLIWRGMSSDNGWIKYITAGIALLVSVYVYKGRLNRKKQAQIFDRSILGEIDNAIANVDYLIARGKTFVWWYLTPFALTLLLTMIYSFDSKTIVNWIMIAVVMVFAGWLPQWEVRKCHLPRKKSLEAMKQTLLQD